MTSCVRTPWWPWVLVGIMGGVVGAGGWPPAALAQPLPAPVFPLIDDPVGDHSTSAGTPVVDIGLVEGGADGTVVTLRITFSPETNMSQVAGVIVLDTDQNPLTGGEGGVEFVLNLYPLLSGGPVDVWDVRSNRFDTVGTVAPVLTGQVLELTVPLALLGGDDGRMDLFLELGNGGPEGTDTTITRLPGGPALPLILTGCTACRAGDRLVIQARMTNRETVDYVVEVKLGLWLPGGTLVNLLGTQHLELPFPAGLDTTAPPIEYVLPAGLPPGRGTVEGRLLEPVLGGLWWESVHPFEVLP